MTSKREKELDKLLKKHAKQRGRVSTVMARAIFQGVSPDAVRLDDDELKRLMQLVKKSNLLIADLTAQQQLEIDELLGHPSREVAIRESKDLAASAESINARINDSPGRFDQGVKDLSALADAREMSTDDARTMAAQRLRAFTEQALRDLHSETTHTMQGSITRSTGAKLWRRKIVADTCAFCIRASTNYYTTPNLEPIHSRCDCVVVAIRTKEDREAHNAYRNSLGYR